MLMIWILAAAHVAEVLRMLRRIFVQDIYYYFQTKPELKIFKWLKPGGQLLISDFCKKPGEISDSFITENKLRSFHMVSVKEYGVLIEQAGFVDVLAEDITESMFIPSLKKDLVKAQGMKEEIIRDCGEEDYHWIIARWNEKLMRTTEGEMKLGLFIAKKPSTCHD